MVEPLPLPPAVNVQVNLCEDNAFVRVYVVFVFVGIAHSPLLFKNLVVSVPSAGPFVIVFAPLNFAKYPLVPLPVTLLAIDGVTVTV